MFNVFLILYIVIDMIPVFKISLYLSLSLLIRILQLVSDYNIHTDESLL